MSKPLKVFITYSHNDQQQNTELKTRLAVMEEAGEIEIWDDNKILPGDEWEKAISENLAESDILLYLTSAPSLASKNCNKELAEALSANIRVIPIILEACDWEKHQLSRFEVLPHKGKPINKWQPESDGWQNVVDGIREVVEKMQTNVQEGTLPEWVFQQGNFLMMLGQIDLAIEAYSHAIELNPNNASTYNNRGNAYGEKGDYDRAIGDHNTAIKLNPDHANTYTNRGIAYGKKGDYDRAIGDHNTAIELNPNLAEPYNNRGAAYDKKHELDRAIVDYTKAIELNPDYAEPYTNRGVAYDKRGDFDRAIGDHNQAIKLNPDYAEAYTNRGTAYLNKGDFDRAIENYNTAIQLELRLAGVYYNRGIAYFNKGDFDRAIEDFSKAIEFNPNDAIAYNSRGMMWLHLKEWDKAVEDLSTARDKGMDIVASFHNHYKSVEAYERANRVKLSEDIALMLTQRRRSRYPKTEKFLSADGTPLESSDVLNLLAKLRNAGPPLSQYIQIPQGEDARRVGTRPTFGIKTGRSGAFVVDSATREQLIADHPASAEVLKPFLHGQDIRRWGVEKPVDKSRSIGDAWLIFSYRGIEIDRYPAIRKHLEQYRSVLSKRAGKQKWYELPVTKRDAERFTQTKLICPNSYDRQTFAVDTDGFYCGDTCYLIPTEETWLCGLLNSRAVEWFYSQVSKQLTGDYLKARSRHIQEIPIPDLTPTQKSLIGKIVDYLIFLQGQPTTSGGDLAHARDFIMLGYFERIIDGLAYESYLREELHQGEKQFFKPLLDERLPQLEEIRGDKMAALREIFECLYERTHPIRRNLFFLNSVKPIRIIEDRT